MHVGVDQPRHDDPASCIYELSGRMISLQISRGADLGNQAILDGDTPVFDEGKANILRDQPPIPNQQH
jgi:hypothetical protein